MAGPEGIAICRLAFGCTASYRAFFFSNNQSRLCLINHFGEPTPIFEKTSELTRFGAEISFAVGANIRKIVSTVRTKPRSISDTYRTFSIWFWERLLKREAPLTTRNDSAVMHDSATHRFQVRLIANWKKLKALRLRFNYLFSKEFPTRQIIAETAQQVETSKGSENRKLEHFVIRRVRPHDKLLERDFFSDY